MDADIVIVRNRLVELFTDSLTESGLDLTITGAWQVTDDLAKMTGRKVYILPINYNPVDPVSRDDKNTFDVGLSILTIERYEEQGDPPNEWVDERVYWNQEKIFNPLCNTRNPLKVEVAYIDNTVTEYWSQSVAVTEVCNLIHLQRKVFWSETEVTLRRIK